MKVYKIFYPVIETAANFKTLAHEDAEEILNAYNDYPRKDYVKTIINICVVNFKLEIAKELQTLRLSSPKAADDLVISLYNGCIMLNPILDINTWMILTVSYNMFAAEDVISQSMISEPKMSNLPADRKKKSFSIPYSKFLNLKNHLNENIVGQKEAIEHIVNSLKRAQANLNDTDRPLGVFLFAGPSGVGKSSSAEVLQRYLFDDTELVRVDCGEYQLKHENQKLFGSSPGFVGYEEGGQLTKAVMKNPNTVVLIDEAEKAHPDFWHTFLKVFDKGFLTDNKGNNVSFRNTIIIISSNLGNDNISKDAFARRAGFNNLVGDSYSSKTPPKRDTVVRETEEAIRKFFKTELINRLDDIIIFNFLTEEDFHKIAELEMLIIANKLSKQHFNLNWNEDVLDLLSSLSRVAISGARGMSMVRRDKIENPLSDVLLNTKHPKGTMFNITVQDHQFVIS